MTHINSLEQALADMPPAWQNNQRQIVRAAISRFKKNPSELHGNEVERLSGVGYDWSDNDHGNGPRGDNE